MDMVNLLQSRYCPFLIYDLPLKCNTTGATRGAGTAYTLGSPEFTPIMKHKIIKKYKSQLERQ
jgi:hypothetical protein